jgi:hypothetical protein
MTDKKKTDLDVLEAMIGTMMGDFGPLAVQEFRQMVLPNLKKSWRPPQKGLSDAEFDATVAKIKEELPYFVAWLTHPDRNLPDLSPDWFLAGRN